MAWLLKTMQKKVAACEPEARPWSRGLGLDLTTALNQAIPSFYETDDPVLHWENQTRG